MAPQRPSDRPRAAKTRPPRCVGVVPAAGMASRLQPLAGSKEMCVVHGRPVIDRLLDRLDAADCDAVLVVTRPEKRDVAAHAAARGARVLLGRPATLGRSLALALSQVGDDEVVLLGFPDTLWEPDDGFRRLRGALGRDVDVVLGLFEADEPERSDVCVLGAGGRVRRVLVKPDVPPSRCIWGCLAARAGALAGVERHEQPGELLDVLARAGRVRGVPLSGPWLDIGTRDALAIAQGAPS